MKTIREITEDSLELEPLGNEVLGPYSGPSLSSILMICNPLVIIFYWNSFDSLSHLVLLGATLGTIFFFPFPI